ncbi:hypothetical protein B0H21DRAFT_711967 [Amylocystis lapponica]|nr:hypothetical protein B0H21DRAFT_711967 [Amylocystis lapponica]
MADTHHKPLKGKVPELYKANPTRTKEFLCQCDNYLDLNSRHLDNDKEQIIWTLTYFDEETPPACRWATVFETKARSGGNWGTWIDFKKKLLSSYDTAVEDKEARTLIEHLHQKKAIVRKWDDRNPMKGVTDYTDSIPTFINKLVKIDNDFRIRRRVEDLALGKSSIHSSFGKGSYWLDIAIDTTPGVRVKTESVDRFETASRPSISNEEFQCRKANNLCFDCGRSGCRRKNHYYAETQGGVVEFHKEPRHPSPATTREVTLEEGPNEGAEEDNDSFYDTMNDKVNIGQINVTNPLIASIKEPTLSPHETLDARRMEEFNVLEEEREEYLQDF